MKPEGATRAVAGEAVVVQARDVASKISADERRTRLVEPLVVMREHLYQWVRPEIDPAELENLRFIEK